MTAQRAVSAVILAFALLAAPAAAPARTGSKIVRIGLLTLSTAPSSPDGEAFRQGFRELGYVEGENVAKALGLTIPPAVLARADQVIE